MKNKIYLEKAFAKINLFLKIIGKRQDGYHDIFSIKHQISFFDTVQISKNNVDSVVSNNSEILLNQENTCIKAVNVMRDEFGIKDKFLINIQKSIPSWSGLGGGSSDAAAAIRIINSIYKLELSKKDMEELGSRIGMDVPFCIFGKTAVAEERGDKLTMVEIPKLHFILIKPPHSISSAWAYSMFKRSLGKIPEYVLKLKEKGKEENKKRFIDFMNNESFNDFEKIAENKHPEIREIKKELLDHGCAASMMTGSGSCVFGICRDEKEQLEIFDRIHRREWFAAMVHSQE